MSAGAPYTWEEWCSYDPFIQPTKAAVSVFDDAEEEATWGFVFAHREYVNNPQQNVDSNMLGWHNGQWSE